MNAHSQQRVAQLAPKVGAMALRVAARLEAQGIDGEVTQGVRTLEEQRAYYAQGRQPLDQVNALRAAVGLAAITDAENVVVTHAMPGESYHEYGCALDWCPFDADGQPIWDLENPAWQAIWDAGKAEGFECGNDWPLEERDAPHMQYTGRFPVEPDGEAWRIMQQGGLTAFWTAAFDGGTGT